jgi:branched-chain amino acid aminotransferase
MGTRVLAWKYNPAEKNGLEPITLAVNTLDEGTQQLPGGGYTTFRTWNGTRVLRMEDHFNRLEESAHLIGKEIRINRKGLRAALRDSVLAFAAAEDSQDCRVRLILDLNEVLGCFYILVTGLHVPSDQEYEEGVRAVTRWMQRENPKAKQTTFIETASQVRRTLPEGVNEALMIGENGRVLEGLSSNFFVVWDGTIWTEDDAVLPGITRQVVLECIRAAGIPLRLEGIWRQGLEEISEAFITSASRSILPVTEIDGKLVGTGKPGLVTLALMAAYWERIDSELEEI